MYCGFCGEECEAVKADEGIGRYECHGYKGFHHDWTMQSDCCGAQVYVDEALTEVYSASEYDYDYACEKADYERDVYRDNRDLYED